MKTRRQFSPEFKAKVALEAIKGLTPLNELAAKYEIHPVQLANWKKAAVEGLAAVFESPRSKDTAESEATVALLYQQIGQLKVELDWLKKKSGISKSGSAHAR